MNEHRFRSLMRDAVGDAPTSPWLNDRVRKRIAQPSRRASRAPLLALVAAFVALAVLAGVIVTPRLLNRLASTTPGASTPKAVDPSNCELPVLVASQQFGTQVVADDGTIVSAPVQAGFVNTATGKFAPDPGSVRNALTPQSSYSAAARRWVPVGPDNLSPDGRSYAYLAYLPAAKQPSGRSAYALMSYDIATRRSTRVWTAEFGINVIKWTTRGIIVVANTDYHGGPYWLVDPATGAAAPVQSPDTLSILFFNAPPFDHGGGINRLGLTSAGEEIYLVSTQDRKTAWVFYDTVDGRRVFISKGSLTNPTDFHPWTAQADGGGIWFTTLQQSSITLWHWDESHGLRQLVVAFPYTGGLNLRLVGACF